MASSSNLKYDGVEGERNNLKSKGYSWAEYHHHTFTSLRDADLVAGGFSWPPRSYPCSFCKREFRSAQALGGHMNVHRRDRARLKLSPELSIHEHQFPRFKRKLVEAVGIRHDHLTMEKNGWIRGNPKAAAEKCTLEGEKACEILKKPEFVGLELRIGLIGESKEELDLELRLGCNS